MSLGERIREARLSKGLTIQEVANKLGVTYQNISQYERDVRNPKPATLRKIAAALGVSVNRLVGVTFPDRLLAILSYRTNLSLADIARAAHVTEEDIHRMTAGDLEPSPETFRALAKVLNVTEDCLAGRTEADIVEPDEPAGVQPDPDDIDALREDLRSNPDRMALLKLARYGTAQEVRQVAAVIDALRATNPDFYDGDDPA